MAHRAKKPKRGKTDFDKVLVRLAEAWDLVHPGDVPAGWWEKLSVVMADVRAASKRAGNS